MLPVPVKRSRKPKKQTEKDIIREHGVVLSRRNSSSGKDKTQSRTVADRQIFGDDTGTKCRYQDRDSSSEGTMSETVLQKQRRIYENFQYLSHKEQASFESKFAVPKSVKQQQLWDQLTTPRNKIVIATGPAGTGKTLFATQMAVRGFLLGSFDKIVFTRPIVSVEDEDIGFLPGDMNEKMAPWMRPLYDILYNYMSPKDVVQLIEEKHIEICPLGFMRGRTFKHCCIVADECQNATPSQIKMLLTRLGEGSRIFITGDLEQCDRKGDGVNGLEDFLDKIRRKRSCSISSVEFGIEDVEREEIVREVLEIYATTNEDYVRALSPMSDASVGSGEGAATASMTELEYTT